MQLYLGVGVDPEPHDIAHVQVHGLGLRRAQHELVGVGRVGQVAGEHGHLVLVEVEAVHAAVAVARAGRELGDVLLGCSVGLEGQEVDPRLALHLCHMREMGQRLDDRGLIGLQPGAGVEDTGTPDEV